MVTSHTGQYTNESIHASTFMSIRIKHNPTIFALELWAWKELHKMVTSHTGQYTNESIHASTFMSIRIKHNPTIFAVDWSQSESKN